MCALAVIVYSLVPGLVAAHPPAVGTAPDFVAVDHYVQKEMQAIGIPGLALAIVQGDRVVHLQGFGVADPFGRAVTAQTPFNIASMSKTFTALAIMQLVEAGSIDLAAPVQRYVPWFRVADPDASAHITIRDLLNHQSGLSTAVGNDYAHKDDTSATALEQRVRALSSVELTQPVGTTYEYSNANYDTLGLVVQVVSGEPYETYIQQHIFAPLEMHTSFPSRREAASHGAATGYRMWFGTPLPFAEPVPRSHLPSGRQFSSAEDLAHVLIAFLNDGRYQDRSVLSAAGIRVMQHTPVSSGPNCATYSMHWSHNSQCDNEWLGLGGDDSNFKARALVAPDTKWGVVLLMNTQAVGINGPRQERIKDGVLDLLLGREPIVSEPHNTSIIVGMSIIALVTVLLVVGLVRSLAVLRRWRSQPEHRPRGWLRVGWRVAVPLALELLWVLFLIGVVQVAAGSRSSMPLRFMLEHIPDLGWLIIVSGTLALGWGVLRTILAIIVLRQHDTSQQRPTSTVGLFHG